MHVLMQLGFVCRYETMIVLRPDMTDEERRASAQAEILHLAFAVGYAVQAPTCAELATLFAQGQ